MKAILWSDKYRPTTREEYVGQEDIYIDVMKYVSSPETMPHLGFTGVGGVGKTSLAMMFADALGDSATVRTFNSDEDKNQAFVEALKMEISKPPVYAVIRLIIMDEVSEMSTKAQTSLRALLELEYPWNKFILIYNHPTKMVEPLLDRVTEFQFHRHDTEDIISRLEAVVSGEGLIPQEGALGIIASRSKGSIRRAHNLLQKYTRDKFVEPQLDDEDDSVVTMFNAIWDADMNKAWDIYLTYQRRGRYVQELPQMIMSVVESKFSKNFGLKAILARHIIQLARDMAMAIEPDVCMFGFFGSIYGIATKHGK